MTHMTPMDSNNNLPPSVKAKKNLLINRNFALLWTGGTISIVGDMLFTTALVVWISVSLAANQSWAPLAVSGIMLATLLPTAICGPIAGVFADRWNKRQTMLWMDALRAIAMLFLLLTTGGIPFLPVYTLSLPVHLGIIYGTVFLVSLCEQFFNPSRMAIIGAMVPDQERVQASSLTMISMSIAMIIAPPLAPIILLATRIQVILIVNALSFVCSFFLIYAIQVVEKKEQPSSGKNTHILEEFLSGLRVSFQNRTILALIISISTVMFGASSINSLDVLFVLRNLHAPADLYGLLSTLQGIGIVIGSILSGLVIKRLGMVRTLTLSLLIIALGLLLYSRLTSFPVAAGTIFFLGVAMATLNVVADPLILRATPQAYIGRVMALINPISSLVQVLGASLAGYLASTLLLHLHIQFWGMVFGPIDSIFSGGAIFILIGAFVSFLLLGTSDPQSTVEKD